jgi:hypothetical protein
MSPWCKHPGRERERERKRKRRKVDTQQRSTFGSWSVEFWLS